MTNAAANRTAYVKIDGVKYYLTDAGYGSTPFAWVDDFNRILNGRKFVSRKAAMIYVGGPNVMSE